MRTNEIPLHLRRAAIPFPMKIESVGRGKHVAVFTALEGALVDARTFRAGMNQRAVQQLRSAGIEVVPVTSMTLDEAAPIARDFGLRKLMIIEAGGAIARWTGSTWEVEPCGPSSDELLDGIRDIEDRSGASLLVYSVMPESEAARLSGRSGEMLWHSMNRHYSEPFIIESGDIEDVKAAALSLGFVVRRGQRFFHLCRATSTNSAFSRVRDELCSDSVIAVGSSPLDVSFLSCADVAIVIPAGAEPDPELLADMPAAKVAPAPAPGGWMAAIEQAWSTAMTPARRSKRTNAEPAARAIAS